ncbi:paired amphipathic helix protein Sin3a isoform X2 [Coccinella septempunctata]|uniref:paired amphipathic helix protein Sin3a isoform X2 n=1 Tax=Coccinella septempunctata TaxID=41139 RepID=UPI001D0688DB|nr:paired amphipathic helix protein Sin3a isoform X2 [Coccinella septempunctata]
MKRLRVDETVKEGGGSLSSTLYRQPISNSSTLSYTTAGAVKVVSEGMQAGIYPSAPSVNYGTMPTVTVTHSGHSQIRNSENSPPSAQEPAQQQSPGSNFHRLKVEDALSYLDLVKFKFNSKPQVYNDFLDIMKEFKSQSIDTPGVIERVSNLFDGFPDLIVGFNTFLPPGYKIEVQKNNDGYAFHVSVSMGNVPGSSENHHKTSMIMKGSGTYNTSVCGQPITHTQQGVPVPSHISPVPSQAPPPQPPIVQHANTYANNATSYNSLSLSAAQAAVSQALQGHSEAPQNQPVEFNHAINYVNKIKNRFQGQPEKYKRFLEILHTYQKEQRTLKETAGGLGGKQLTEQEVYSQVAKLFENQSDLLAEFGQFLPDATSHMNQVQSSELHSSKKLAVKPTFRENLVERSIPTKVPITPCQKRSLSPYSSCREGHTQKKHKLSSSRDSTLSEARKYGTLKDYAFFDKLRKSMKSYDTYENFLRCLTLYNEQIVTRGELILMVNPLLGKFPELMRWFKDFLRSETENVSFNTVQNERPKGDLAQEIDFATAKRLGASYCIIPASQEVQVSSSRTQLCKEVLNDQWVSFPTWSEDSTFVGSRKTQYEEYMYRCEDERFEMDVVIETNAATIRVLENVQKKISRMKPEELSNFTLDDNLGGSSAILHQKALKRIYGERAKDIIEGLKCNPAAAIGTILTRLKSKEVEWREAQKGFNKIWREQNEKYYLKSLDHQGMNFKATDVKALRSKSLFNEIETLFDERHEQNEESGGEVVTGPHIVIPYKDRTILDDATNLLIHNVKRQTGIQKSEKHKIKQFLFRTLPEFFFHPKQHLSDDEEDEKEEGESPNSSPSSNRNSKSTSNCGKSPVRSESDRAEPESNTKEQTLPHAQTNDPEEAYTLFMGNNNWYIFLRLHAILCDRLSKIYERSVILAEEEARQQPKRKESTAISLRLKPKPHIEVQEYYPAFLEMVKNLLDGNMDANAYEDTLREMFGIYAYVAFTLDKVVSNAVRQLQHCVSEKTAKACTDLFLSEQKKGATGGLCITAYKRAHAEFAYQRAAEKAVQDENCFKIFFYKKDCRMTIELLDTENDDGKRVEETKKWSMYRESYSDCMNTGKIKSPVFLERNLRLILV